VLIGKDRQPAAISQEKEDAWYLSLPAWLLRRAVGLLNGLHRLGWLPQSFVESNPLYASLFIANLGSLGMNSVWHHLYRLGDIPLFASVGAPYDAPVVEAGQIVAAKLLSIKWTFDERIDDGYNAGQALQTITHLLENPQMLL
jgi:hypothetical protein